VGGGGGGGEGGRKEKCTTTHNAIQDAFASITREAKFHASLEHTHVLPSPSLQSSRQWVNVMFITNGVCTSIKVVIIDQNTFSFANYDFLRNDHDDLNPCKGQSIL
jgi:hypothetical protein